MSHGCITCSKCGHGCPLCEQCPCSKNRWGKGIFGLDKEDIFISLSDEEYAAIKMGESMQQRDDDFFVPMEISLEEAHENKETFFARLEPFYPPSVMLDIKLAYILAKHGHRAQFRKELDKEGAKVRYFEHVRRVALILFDEARCTRPEMIVAALLHDGIEDTRDLTDLMIEHCFGPDVVSIVKILSKAPKEGYLERFAMCKDWRPYVIKACDRLDNLRSLSGETITPEFREKQIKETEEKYLPLFLTMIELTPKRCKSHALFLLNSILDQLKTLKAAAEKPEQSAQQS